MMTVSNTPTNNQAAKSKAKTFLFIGSGLIAAIWATVIATIFILDPTLKTKAVILALGAGGTELVLYAGAAWFGVTIFKRFRDKIRMRRG